MQNYTKTIQHSKCQHVPKKWGGVITPKILQSAGLWSAGSTPDLDRQVQSVVIEDLWCSCMWLEWNTKKASTEFWATKEN